MTQACSLFDPQYVWSLSCVLQGCQQRLGAAAAGGLLLQHGMGYGVPGLVIGAGCHPGWSVHQRGSIRCVLGVATTRLFLAVELAVEVWVMECLGLSSELGAILAGMCIRLAA